MRQALVAYLALKRKIELLTDQEDEVELLALDCSLRFLLDNPADQSLIVSQTPNSDTKSLDVISLGVEDYPVDWTVYRPSGGLSGWIKEWSPGDAGLYGHLAHECQLLTEQTVKGRKGAIERIDRKVAAKFLRKYQSLQDMVDNLEQIRPLKYQEAIVEAWQGTRQAAVINPPGPPVPRPPITKVYWNEIDRRNKDASTDNYIVVRTQEALWRMVEELEATGDYLVVDTETTSLDPWWLDPCGISISTYNGRAFYIPTGHDTGETQLDELFVRDILRILLLSRPLVMHNASFDLRVLEKLVGIPWQRFKVLADTQIMAFVCGLGTGDDAGTLKLSRLSERLLGIKMQDIHELIGTGKSQIPFSKVLIEKAGPYAAADADITGRLYRVLKALVDELGVSDILEMEMSFLPTIVQMEENGVAVDLGVVGKIDEVVTANIASAEASLYEACGHEFDLDSPEAVSAVLYDELQLPPGKRTLKAYSTEATHLKTLVGKHPAVQLMLEYREMTKLKSTYVDNLQKYVHPITNRLHVSWNQCGAASGRLSSSGGQVSKINLQNQPARTEVGKAIRGAFVAEEGWVLVGGDYSQVELRLTAHVSEDVNMMADFHSGQDFHKRTASRMFKISLVMVTHDQRQMAKNFNFGVNYRISARGAATRWDLSEQRAKELIQAYYDTYPGVREWQNETLRFVRHQGYSVTMFGRKRWFPDIVDPSSKIRGEAERAAINMPIQGTAADIIKMAMIKSDPITAKLGALILMQVHDEVTYEVPRANAEELRWRVEDIYSNIVTLKVPVVFPVVIGHSWAELKED